MSEGGMLSQLLPALERQQMLERERLVVKSLHDRGICLGPEGCIICKEHNEAMHEVEKGNIGAQGCVARQPSVFDDIAKIPLVYKDPAELESTLNQRGQKYGDYGYMATCAQRIKEAMGPRAHLSAVQRESLDLIATKIARICCGDPNVPDSWLDIEGYAKLARDRLAVQPDGANPATP